MTGIIKKISEKGYGFITQDDNSGDIFFHANGLVGTTIEELREGDKVSFETEEAIKDGQKKMNAVNVQRA